MADENNARTARRRTTWAQVERSALAQLDDLLVSDVQAGRVMLALIRLLEPDSGGVVVISNAALCELLRVSESTIKRALRVLLAGNWIQRLRVGSAYALAVNTRVAWCGPRGDRSHAVFRAVVVAARSEQDAAALDPAAALRRVGFGTATIPAADLPLYDGLDGFVY